MRPQGPNRVKLDQHDTECCLVEFNSTNTTLGVAIVKLNSTNTTLGVAIVELNSTNTTLGVAIVELNSTNTTSGVRIAELNSATRHRVLQCRVKLDQHDLGGPIVELNSET